MVSKLNLQFAPHEPQATCKRVKLGTLEFQYRERIDLTTLKDCKEASKIQRQQVIATPVDTEGSFTIEHNGRTAMVSSSRQRGSSLRRIQ
jgi:hypothetical protein